MLVGIGIFDPEDLLLCLRCIGCIHSSFYCNVQNILVNAICNIHGSFSFLKTTDFPVLFSMLFSNWIPQLGHSMSRMSAKPVISKTSMTSSRTFLSFMAPDFRIRF